MFSLALILPAIYVVTRIVGEVADGTFLEYVDWAQERFGVSDAVAGELFQALGTSAPEIAVNAYATYAVMSNPAVGVSTIIGSAVFQLTVVIAAPILLSDGEHRLSPAELARGTAVYAVAVLLLLAFAADGVFHTWELAVLVAAYAAYVAILLTRADHTPSFEETDDAVPSGWFAWFDTPARRLSAYVDDTLPGPASHVIGLPLCLVVIGVLCGVAVELTEAAGIVIGLPGSFMALTVLAAASSIPELSSNASKAREGKFDQVVGNALGSNTFDILMSFGGVSLIAAWQRGGLTMPDPGAVFIPSVLLLFSLGLVVTVFWAARWRTKRWTAWSLLSFYVAFVGLSLFLG